MPIVKESFAQICSQSALVCALWGLRCLFSTRVSICRKPSGPKPSPFEYAVCCSNDLRGGSVLQALLPVCVSSHCEDGSSLRRLSQRVLSEWVPSVALADPRPARGLSIFSANLKFAQQSHYRRVTDEAIAGSSVWELLWPHKRLQHRATSATLPGSRSFGAESSKGDQRCLSIV